MVRAVIEAGGFNLGTFPEFNLSHTAVTATGLRKSLTEVTQHTELSKYYSGLRIYQSSHLIGREEEYARFPEYSSATSLDAKAWRALAADFSRKIDFLESEQIIP